MLNIDRDIAITPDEGVKILGSDGVYRKVSDFLKGSHCYGFDDGFKLCPCYEVIEGTSIKYAGDVVGNICKCNFLNITTKDLIDEDDAYGAWLLYDKCKICGM